MTPSIPTDAVMTLGPQTYDICGQSLPRAVLDTDTSISAGLVTRLHRYALRELSEAGFEVAEWPCEVYTLDGHVAPAERYYTVEFTHAKGGMVGLAGILTRHGHPFMHQEVCADTRRDR